MAYGASELDQSQDTTNTAVGLNNSNETSMFAQSFTAGKTGLIDKVIAKLEKIGTPTGTLTGYIYADDGSSPTGSALSTSSNIDVAGITTTDGGAEYTFEFPNDFTQVAGTKYWFVIDPSYSMDTGNYIQWSMIQSDAYASGNRNRYDSSTSAWLDDQGTFDTYFKTYILPYKEEGGSFLFNLT